jgi:hypothetical protein
MMGTLEEFRRRELETLRRLGHGGVQPVVVDFVAGRGGRMNREAGTSRLSATEVRALSAKLVAAERARNRISPAMHRVMPPPNHLPPREQ